MVQRDLIFDLGMYEGQDFKFYLSKGFRVVALEANPELCRRNSETFAKEIAERPAHHRAQGAVDTRPASTSRSTSTRPGAASIRTSPGATTARPPRCRWPPRQSRKCSRSIGVPHYLKCDIEGADKIVCDQVSRPAAQARLRVVRRRIRRACENPGGGRLRPLSIRQPGPPAQDASTQSAPRRANSPTRNSTAPAADCSAASSIRATGSISRNTSAACNSGSRCASGASIRSLNTPAGGSARRSAWTGWSRPAGPTSTPRARMCSAGRLT